MATFTSDQPSVRLPTLRRTVTFEDGLYETDDHYEILNLRKHSRVEEVESELPVPDTAEVESAEDEGLPPVVD